MVLGADRQPLRLPLDTSHDDLGDMLGPGSYRFEAVDESGAVLDCVVCAGVGETQRERAAPSEAPAAPVVAGFPARASELRVVMEANVQMARSLADAVRVLSEAQADWTKGLATAKAIPRNAAPVPLVAPAPPAPPPSTASDDAEEESFEPTWYERMVRSIPAEHLADVIESIGGLVDRFMPAKARPRNAASDSTEEESETEGGGEDSAESADAGAAAVPLTPEMFRKIDAVKARLSPKELGFVTEVVKSAGPHVVAELARELAPLSVEEAVVRVRKMIVGPEGAQGGQTKAQEGENS